MGSFDSITWQVLTVVLTLLGLAGSVAFWRLRGPAAGLRMLGVALLPSAAYLTGTLRLLWEIGDAVVSWVARLTFSPSVWLGVAIAGVAVLLFVLAGVLGRRGVGGAGRRERQQLPRSTSRPAAKPSRPAGATSEDDELADIEAILKRHGIQ